LFDDPASQGACTSASPVILEYVVLAASGELGGLRLSFYDFLLLCVQHGLQRLTGPQLMIHRYRLSEPVMSTTSIRAVLLGLVLAFAAALAQVQAASVPQTKGEIVYVTGGVGADEREKLKAIEKDFNLKLILSLTDGAFIADVAVVIKDASGKVVLSEQAQGPIFMAKLPPGTYTVEATFEGKTEAHKVTVGKGLTTVQLRWPRSVESKTVL
jgi:hypothetical protein